MISFLKILVILLAVLWARNAIAHVDSGLLPENCGSCHVGHGLSGQPLLSDEEEDFCYRCHGSENNRLKMIASGKLSPIAKLNDLEKEFNKLYRHPVETGYGHRPDEQLPSVGGGAVSHAECVDCHNPHQKLGRGLNKVDEVSGYSISGRNLENARYEYEICFKCHLDVLDYNPDNILSEFSTSFGSQHPITVSPSGKDLKSLDRSFTKRTQMKCSDCHTNDDKDGPRGPHGSNHRFLLSGNYRIDPYGEESPFAYEFCYSCHDRFSILSNESFPYHREHIEGNPLKNMPGTSCYTCHASHGSPENKNLIRFNPAAVTDDTKTGTTRYRTLGDGSGECYLTCHNHIHSPARYKK
jgi:predicted CXXCH cytochrome family protein